MKLALDNIITQYAPEMIGVATTCLAETIGDDVPMFIHQYRQTHADCTLPPIVHVATPSYQGTHMQGFHRAVLAVVRSLAAKNADAGIAASKSVNLFPGMVSPADLRHLKDITAAFGLRAMLLPDYSQTLDGGLWETYQRIPSGGTPVAAIVGAGSAGASIEMGHVLAAMSETAACFLETHLGVRAVRLGLPIGIRQTDAFMETLSAISGSPVPDPYIEARGRLLDALVDGHKYVNQARAVVYGEADLVAGMVSFLSEIGILPVICATGERNAGMTPVISRILEPRHRHCVQVIEGVDFVEIEDAVRDARPDLMIGHSKGYSLSRRLDVPLVRIGFPIHDRVGGSRLLHLGYEGAQNLFDRIANTLLEGRQAESEVGYTYM